MTLRTSARFGGALLGALCLLAQSDAPSSAPSRDKYRAAYQAWRSADPGLDHDSGSAGEALAPRSVKAAAAAAAYGAARMVFLRDLAGRQAQNLQILRETAVQPVPDLSPAPELLRFTNREMNTVSASAATFANDPDRLIQQLRQAFQREQASLEILKSAIGDRQTAEGRAAKAALAGEQARAKALEQYPLLASALAQSADLMGQEMSAWAAYYPALAEASRALAAPAPDLSATGAPSANQQNQAARVITSTDPAPIAVRPPSITPLPLSRYVGVWAFQAGGAFHGPEPEFVDLAVHEDHGHAAGTFYARFKLPLGTAGDPVVRFEFSGDFQATRNQTFALQTADGVTGTMTLYPGGPFNVLELTFESEVKEGKIHQADVLLVKQ